MYTYYRRIGIIITIIFLIYYLKPVYIVYDVIPYNAGKAVLLDNNTAITAAHLLNDKSEELYKDIENDIAVVKINKTLSISPTKHKLKICNNNSNIKVIDYLPYFGQSGDAYIENGTFIGIIIGRKDNKGIVSCIDRKCYMSIKKSILSLGVVTVFAGQVAPNVTNDKFYQPGIYYYGDNTTEVNYQSIYNGINEAIPSGFVFSTSSPKFNSIPSAIKDYKKIGDKASFFQEEVDYSTISDKSEYTFGFAKPAFIYVPLDCKVISVSPNIPSGKIPNFDSYFTGQGVTCTVIAENFDSAGKQIEIKITYSNLSKNWQSIGLSESYRDKATNRELFYSNFVEGITYEFKAGACIAETGMTGSFTEIEDCNSYVTISLEKRIKGTRDWIAMNFKEIYTTLQ